MTAQQQQRNLIIAGSVALASIGSILLLRGRGVPVDPACAGLGDVDLDGFISDADSQLIADFLVGLATLTPEQMRRADVNRDGEVTSTDALMIAQVVNGLITNFPGCPPPNNIQRVALSTVDGTLVITP